MGLNTLKFFYTNPPIKLAKALDPVVGANQQQWSATGARFSPEDIAAGSMLNAECPVRQFVCGLSSFPDYRVWSFDYLFKQLRIDGYYYDNQIFRPCKNPDHKDHRVVDDKGNEVEITPLLVVRETYKRIYRALKKQNEQAIIVGHESLVAYPFVDIAIGLEAMLPLAGDKNYYTSFMGPDDCRGSYFRGHQRGIPFLWLPEYRGKMQVGEESVRAGRAMLSLLWLCDAQYWAAWANMGVLHKDLSVRGRFKIWQAKWHPFWNQHYAFPEQEDVKVAVYQKPEASLLFISNPGKNAYKKATIAINVGDGMFGPRVDLRELEIRDAETGHIIEGQRWPAEDKMFYNIELDIPDQDFRIVVIGAPQAVKDSVMKPLNARELKAVEDRRNEFIQDDPDDSAKESGPAEIIVNHAKGSIVIDGKLDEQDWANAPAYTGFLLNADKTTPAQEQTSIRMLYDNDHLYFAAEMFDTEVIQLAHDPKQTVEKHVLQFDTIEWYIGTTSKNDYHWFAMNVMGFKGDAHFGGPYDEPFVWDGNWSGRVTRHADRWVIEAAIPLSEISLELDGEELITNIGRSIRPPGGKKVFSILNGQTGGFHSLDVRMVLQK